MSRKTRLGLLASGILLGNTMVVTESLASGIHESSTLWSRVANDPTGMVGDTCLTQWSHFGQVPNNSEVVIKAIKKDRKGKAWAKIIQKNSESSSGYVVLKYLQCV
jgi:hypothetical protein